MFPFGLSTFFENEMLFLALLMCPSFDIYQYVLYLLFVVGLLVGWCCCCCCCWWCWACFRKHFCKVAKIPNDWTHRAQHTTHNTTPETNIQTKINLMKQLYPMSIIFLYQPNINLLPFSIAYRLAFAGPLYGLIACWRTKLIEIAIPSCCDFGFHIHNHNHNHIRIRYIQHIHTRSCW